MFFLFQTEIREHESISRAKNKGDSRLQAAQNKIEKITQEVDSLKTVLEIKTKEVRASCTTHKNAKRPN